MKLSHLFFTGSMSILCFLQSAKAANQDSLTLTQLNAYAMVCESDFSCERALEDVIITVNLQEQNNGIQSGSFDDFAHLTTGELFSYQMGVIESTNPAKPFVEIIQTCQLESVTGELLYECPKQVKRAKSRALVKPSDFAQMISRDGKNYKIKISYRSAE